MPFGNVFAGIKKLSSASTIWDKLNHFEQVCIRNLKKEKTPENTYNFIHYTTDCWIVTNCYTNTCYEYDELSFHACLKYTAH